MKKILYTVLLIVVGVLFVSGCAAPAAAEPEPSPLAATPAPEVSALDPGLPAAVGKLHWFGVSSILYHGSKTIYFDPVMLDGQLPPADIILISHAHSDHADLESLKKIIASGTILVISPNVSSFFNSNEHEIGVAAAMLDEGETTETGGVKIRAVPAYDTVIHFRDSKGMGYVVTVDGETIYFAGGTRFFPGMAEIESDVTIYPWYRNDDILLAANELNTKVLIPVHAGASGVKAFVDVYAKDITNLTVISLEPGPYNPSSAPD
jgi:L-ascorbate metabolism protein UlaG (beta-lactamase superfamily)